MAVSLGPQLSVAVSIIRSSPLDVLKHAWITPLESGMLASTIVTLIISRLPARAEADLSRDGATRRTGSSAFDHI
jgi:hypothetical protein